MEEKLVCIKTYNPNTGVNSYDRVPRSRAIFLMEGNPHVKYTSKSAHKRYVLHVIKAENNTRREMVRKSSREKLKKQKDESK